MTRFKFFRKSRKISMNKMIYYIFYEYDDIEIFIKRIMISITVFKYYLIQIIKIKFVIISRHFFNGFHPSRFLETSKQPQIYFYDELSTLK